MNCICSFHLLIYTYLAQKTFLIFSLTLLSTHLIHRRCGYTVITWTTQSNRLIQFFVGQRSRKFRTIRTKYLAARSKSRTWHYIWTKIRNHFHPIIRATKYKIVFYCTNRQWCFRRPNQNSVWQLVHCETAWSGTQRTDVDKFAELLALAMLAVDVTQRCSSTASQEQTDAFSMLSNAEFW